MKDVLSVAKVEDFDGNQEGHASVRSSGLLRLRAIRARPREV